MTPPDTLSVSSLNLLLGWPASAEPTCPPSAGPSASGPVANRDARVPVATIQRLWPLALAATHDPHLALHLGRFVNFASVGTLAYVTLHAPTLGAALAQLCRY